MKYSLLVLLLVSVYSQLSQAVSYPSRPDSVCVAQTGTPGKLFKLYLKDVEGYRRNYKIDLFTTTNTVANKGRRLMKGVILPAKYESGRVMSFENDDLRLSLRTEIVNTSSGMNEARADYSVETAYLDVYLNGNRRLKLTMNCGVAYEGYPQP